MVSKNVELREAERNGGCWCVGKGGDVGQSVNTFSYIRWLSSGGRVCNMVALANDIQYTLENC